MPAVVNQGYCGSCWTFAATAVLEFTSCLKSGKPVTLSQQQLVDCLGKDGCNGGNAEKAWQYIASIGGQDTISSYPYVSGTTEHANPSCKFSAQNVGATVSTTYSSAVVALPSNDINSMKAALASNKILAIAVDFVSNAFYQYKSGVFMGPCEDSSSQGGHAMTAVGYGTSSNGVDYWIIRNSWGNWWGIAGYVLYKQGLCGVEKEPQYTTSTTGSVTPGVAPTFVWKSGAKNKIQYSNCAYLGDSQLASEEGMTSDQCVTLCASSSSCSYFAWIGYGCYFMKNGIKYQPMIPQTDAAYGGTGVCGYKVTSG